MEELLLGRSEKSFKVEKIDEEDPESNRYTVISKKRPKPNKPSDKKAIEDEEPEK